MIGAAPRRALAAWCIYDFGIAAWPVVIATFVWGAYFTKAIAASSESGAADWGRALAVAGAVVALLSPVLGAIADHGGRRKPWIGVFALLCVAATALLWFSLPRPTSAAQTLILVAIASIAYELGTVFYNAMLRDLVPPSRLGRLSGWGWGAGYIGGLACLAIALFGFIQSPTPPFGLEKATAAPVRATAPLVALWLALFALPLFVFAPDRPKGARGFAAATRQGLAALAASLRRLPRERTLFRFLVARMIYADGLNTLFIFGGIFAAGAIGFSLEQVVLFGIAINATAGLGAILFAWVDDGLGSQPTIAISLAALIGLGIAVLLVHSQAWFWGLGLALGVFVGPAQAASRSLMARLAPKGVEAEMFGIYALTGKVTAFVGPALYGWLTVAFDSQRAGMAVVVAFLAIGLGLLLTVKVAR
ncbi:MAG TPA: MFS transporter [Alphaproteobacteria bacterium]|nr:MFS transporter [Alphaproteobacteria bacterium]